MAKKKAETDEQKRIPVSELEIGGVYKSAVQDLVRIEKLDEEDQKVVVYNISGAHRMWISMKHIFLVEKVYQSR